MAPRWSPKASTSSDSSSEASHRSGTSKGERTLRWLCGLWKDTKGSSYKLSLGEDGVMSVCTTRPSGEVIYTSGLIRVDEKKGNKIIWGKPCARAQYILDKQTHRSLCWRASSGTAQPFTWERLEEPEMFEALEAHDWPLRKEDNTARRAQLRRQFREERSLLMAEKKHEDKKQRQWSGQQRQQEMPAQATKVESTDRRSLDAKASHQHRSLDAKASHQHSSMVPSNLRHDEHDTELPMLDAGYVAELELMTYYMLTGQMPWTVPVSLPEGLTADPTDGLTANMIGQWDADDYAYTANMAMAYQNWGS